MTVTAAAGSGGSGCVSYEPRRGRLLKAAGGHGGRGGDVILRATRRVLSLQSVPQLIMAASGDSGRARTKLGALGADRIVDVPVGTIVKVLPQLSEADTTDEEPSDGLLPRWMTHPHEPIYGELSDSEGEESDDEQGHEDPQRSASDRRAHGTDATQPATGRRRSLRRRILFNTSSSSSNSSSGGSDGGNNSSSYEDHQRHDHHENDARSESGAAAVAAAAAAAGGSLPVASRSLQQLPGPRPQANTPPAASPHAHHHTSNDEDEAAAVGARSSVHIVDEDAARVRRQARKRVRNDAHAAEARTLAELMTEGQQVIVAKGGAGGLGNSAFKSKPHGAPSDRHDPGAAGQRIRLLLLTKTLADVGFVGLPNAGKSTLLRALTGARALVADYQFTTLRPQLGALRYSDGGVLTLADIPGLIAGAHANRGRGNAFLRHVERTGCLAYVVDLSGGEGQLVPLAPEEQLRVLQNELREYKPELLEAPAVVVANKVDCVQQAAAALQRLKQHTPHPIVPVSALEQGGLTRLADALRLMVPGAAPMTSA